MRGLDFAAKNSLSFLRDVSQAASSFLIDEKGTKESPGDASDGVRARPET